jgi:hypothetical protein
MKISEKANCANAPERENSIFFPRKNAEYMRRAVGGGKRVCEENAE